ncbi:MAG: hypothetical protein MK135_00200 [Polyangiaceae bacterium]|nr:hypothetical protein [Polyangiaceae bacterium]
MLRFVQNHPPLKGRIWGISLLLALLAAAWSGGCRREAGSTTTPKKNPRPTLRVVAWGGAAGAIEPCGCVKDMLGGVDHAASWLDARRGEKSGLVFVAAGPMFFLDPTIAPEAREQAMFKAEAMAASLRDLRLSAWAPGANDWALGTEVFKKLQLESGAQALAANLGGLQADFIKAEQVVEVNGLKVGLIGISDPTYPGGALPVKMSDPVAALKKGYDSLRAKDVDVAIALIAAQRGKALRWIENVPGFQVVVLGKSFDQGENNDQPIPALQLNQTLVVQGQNHIQGMSVVDLYVRNKSFSFSDGTGLALKEQRASLERRIQDYRRLILRDEKKKPASKTGLNQKKARLERLEKQLAALPESIPAPAGSYYKYELVEVKESLGDSRQVSSRLEAYYRRVNQHNQKVFANKLPPEVAEGQASYVGVNTCAGCHSAAKEFWDTTQHAHAYATLSNDHKEFNLDCVSCHVTGYEKPGGSTVTHVEQLKNVQCETCHGPGSLHIQNPVAGKNIQRSPPSSLCEGCHHPPHVGADWTVAEALPHILGPGHGQPLPAATPQD